MAPQRAQTGEATEAVCGEVVEQREPSCPLVWLVAHQEPDDSAAVGDGRGCLQEHYAPLVVAPGMRGE
jgi:hypothetical protein